MSRKTRRPSRTDGRQARLASLRAEQAARQRRQRIAWWGGGGVVVVAIAVVVAVTLAGRGPGTTTAAAAEVLPPGVAAGAPDVQPAALQVANPSGIPGVVAYDTTGWPTSSHNGPAAQALRHNHVGGPVTYSLTPPVGGDHNAAWANCGVYDKPIPTERAVHDLEHGAVWITYQPNLPRAQLAALDAFQARQSKLGGTPSRYIDLTPYPGLPTPIVISSWGFQLRVSSPTDPRLQRFVDTFRNSPRYSPEYGGECTGGLGTPLRP